ncbi:hypothetical protein FHS30_001408 [Simiduia aestuariiviva]|uniref:Uncharacterized protein n=1 Tax=Simiduia aestuariiviva TaxID=1510459 RepID=A0A839UJE0_9GAMM|nr:hypothetical protein [Simiduia aestuariiviva]
MDAHVPQCAGIYRLEQAGAQPPFFIASPLAAMVGVLENVVV